MQLLLKIENSLTLEGPVSSNTRNRCSHPRDGSANSSKIVAKTYGICLYIRERSGRKLVPCKMPSCLSWNARTN